MKNNFHLVVLFLILNSCSAGLKCCEKKNEVANFLTGFWKENNSDSKFLIEYSFDQQRGYYKEVEPTGNEGEYIIIDDHPFVEILQKGREFEIKFTDLTGTRISKIKFLDIQTLILVSNGIVTEFNKVQK